MDTFCSRGLNFDPMTLIYEPGVDTLKMYLRTRNKFLDQSFRKLEPEHDRRTDRCDRTYYHAAFASGKYLLVYCLKDLMNISTLYTDSAQISDFSQSELIDAVRRCPA